MLGTRTRKISLQPISQSSSKIVYKHLSNQLRTLSCRPPSNTKLINHMTPNPLLPHITKTTKINAPSKLKVEKPTTMSNRQKNPILGFDNRIFCQQRSKSVKSNFRLQGLSKEALSQRKESHLNTYFNLRKNKLKDITKENKKIYVRINSQKSLYSSRKLNGSQDSISQSRISHKSSQHSLRSSKNSTNSLVKKAKINNQKIPQNKIRIASKNVNLLQKDEVNRYLNIFCNHINLNTNTIQSKLQKRNQFPSKDKQNKYVPMSSLDKIVQQVSKQTRKRNPATMTYLF